jgi:hypothetical protein
MIRSRCALLVLGLLSTVGINFAGIISFTPSSQTVAPGMPFSVGIQVTNPGPMGVGDFDLAITFNSAILSASVINFGTFLGGPVNSIQGSSIGPGSLELSEVSFLSSSDLIALQPSSFTLATITFSGLGLGSSPLNFSAITIDDANGSGLDLSSLPGSVLVQSAPEPSYFGIGAVLLFGILTIGTLRSTSKRRA